MTPMWTSRDLALAFVLLGAGLLWWLVMTS